MSEQSLTTQASTPAGELTPTDPEKPKKDKKHKRKRKDFQPFFGDVGDSQDKMPAPPILPPSEPTPESSKASNSKQPAYSDKDRRLLAHLIAIMDKSGILNAAKQDAGTREKKDKIWGSIVKAFNAKSGRVTPSNREQLTKLAAKMRSEVRASSDENHAALLKKFRLSCAQTGGGSGLLPPKDFDPDEDLASEDSSTESARDSFEDGASDLDGDLKSHGVVELITNNRAPLLTRHDDITAPESRRMPRRSNAVELPEAEVQMVLVNGVPKASSTLKEPDGEGELENGSTSRGAPSGTSRKGRNLATNGKCADSVKSKKDPLLTMKPEPRSESLQREADATISYLDTRRKNDEGRDQLECQALEASIRHHNSGEAANDAKKDAYEAMAAWYRKQLANYPVPPPVNYSPHFEDSE